MHLFLKDAGDICAWLQVRGGRGRKSSGGESGQKKIPKIEGCGGLRPWEDVGGRSSREQAGLAMVSVSGTCIQGLEEATRCRVLRLGG